MYNPSVKGETFDIQGGQIDVMPTLEYLMGVDKEKYQRGALGKVLVNINKKYTILEDFKMYGEYTPQDEKHTKDGIMYLIRWFKAIILIKVTRGGRL